MQQPFSPDVVRRCWELAQGGCECQRDEHGHHGRCAAALHPSRHGLLGDGGWLSRAWTPLDQGGADHAENAEALCWLCYQRTTQETAGC